MCVDILCVNGIFPELFLYRRFLNEIKAVFVIELRHEISNNEVCATSKGSDQPANMRSLVRTVASRLYIL